MLAGLLSWGLLFAPLAYAANFKDSVYAWLHGSWITITAENGSDHLLFYQNIGLFAYTVLAAGIGGTLLMLIFYPVDPIRKRRILLIAMLVMGGLLLLGFLLKSQLPNFLGSAPPEDMGLHFEMQFWLHFFPPIFAYRAYKGISRDIGVGVTGNEAQT